MTNHNELNPHFLQTSYWAEARGQSGWEPLWIGDCLLLVRPLPLIRRKIGYMPQVDLNKILWDELQTVAKHQKLTHILIDPNNLESEFTFPVNVVEKYNLVRAKPLFYRHTTIIDLTKSDDELGIAMKPKTRYNLGLALKKGVRTEVRDDDEALEIFLALFFETVKRQRYFGRTPEYYRKIFNTLRKHDKVKIAIAWYEDKPLVAWFLMLGDKVVYYPYGGSSTENRNVMANYALVWKIIKWAQKEGYKYFDLWGTLGENAKENDPEFGFHRFKVGWGGEQISYVSSYNMVISKFWFNLFRFGNAVRWIGLKLKKLVTGK